MSTMGEIDSALVGEAHIQGYVGVTVCVKVSAIKCNIKKNTSKREPHSTCLSEHLLNALNYHGLFLIQTNSDTRYSIDIQAAHKL
ncbi:DEHA2B09790p [Debaryomyces hansenii CBS767]|uniref:DEHA2B09790p n=1 Tax=Debaryomyces hansenii (strain ATCC 36239 / CBS 767 / BCRC 21394 / JCM 1990 / NBRC 0083 / IGC 2968) TaxID=284592 RepID=B5RT05_DEBHA|nr:DEHA2B09790p [Debaryomyces hansenii CBS767]CAR65478.1 DEHA2B09790p [Debaryomyces hansenii CBS767]|eukprot:XP_002770108.1 DEHA2B09790p [Debaryomyces hansenii CBS767]